MDDLSTDVCVVGAGPAGLTLAVLLLRSGARVAVVEKSASLDRAYRGEILQPGGMRILDQLGVLAGARERGGYELTRFQLLEYGRPVLDMDYRRLPGPHNHLLSIPQRHVLAELLAECRRHDGFTLLSGHRLTGLLRDGGDTGPVTGAVVSGPDGERVVRSRCLVGADGRYSKTRRLAGIENRRMDVFDLDVLWFRLPNDGPVDGRARILRADGPPVLAYDSYPGSVQLGWTLPHGRYREVAELGIDHIKEQASRVVPEYAELIGQRLTRLTDLTLLDVFGARADRWAADGLLLIGDAAHTHSPLGAQGINLAVQDAAVAHPILVAALAAGDTGAAALGEFQRRRGPDIDAVMRFQVMQSKGMFGTGGLAGFLRPKVAKVLMRTPVGATVTRHVTMGNPRIRVHHELRLPSPVPTPIR
jgi:6-methylpretetramide 4-monooxygenase